MPKNNTDNLFEMDSHHASNICGGRSRYKYRITSTVICVTVASLLSALMVMSWSEQVSPGRLRE